MTNLIKKLIVTGLSIATVLGIAAAPAFAFAKSENGKGKGQNKVNYGQIISAEKKLINSANKIGDDQGDGATKPENILFNDNGAINALRQTYVQAINAANTAYKTAVKAAHDQLVSALSAAGSNLSARTTAFRTYLSSLLTAFQQKAAAKEAALQQFINSLGNVTTNQAPTANSQSVTATENIARTVTLTGSDPENSTLTFTILANPTHGTLSGTAPSLTYTPSTNFVGSDSFTFKVNDGTLDSATATVSITVVTDQAPTANAQSVTVAKNVAKPITLTGSDPENSALIYTVLANPTHGTLSGTAPSLTYTPSTDFTGTDSFTFKVNDGTLDSATATVSITVNP